MILVGGKVTISVPQCLRSILASLALTVALGACATEPMPPGPAWGLKTADSVAVETGADPRSQQVAQTDSGEESDDDFGDLGAEPDDNDPLEVPNRMFFAFNEALDFMIIRPITVTYNFIVPRGVRNTVTNFLRNLRSPVVLANDLLQGDFDRAGTTAARFFINSTLGILGLFDFATDEGYVYHNEDFGQTLGTYGVGEGFYLVLPILGPSSARDGTGLIVDIFLDPLTYILPFEYGLARAGATGLDASSRNIDTLDELREDSVDFYARIRSLYRQNRENEINNGEPSEDSPDFSDSPALEAVEPSPIDQEVPGLQTSAQPLPPVE